MKPDDETRPTRLARWNARYAAGEGRGRTHAAVLDLVWKLAAPGRALDVACGAGRNALALASRGWSVVAVDGAAEAVAIVRKEAEARGLASRIEARVADLESSARSSVLAPESYDLVCDILYLDRSLFDELRGAVRPGGLFVASIHTSGTFALEPGELERTIAAWGWSILVSREQTGDTQPAERPTATIVARRV